MLINLSARDLLILALLLILEFTDVLYPSMFGSSSWVDLFLPYRKLFFCFIYTDGTPSRV